MFKQIFAAGLSLFIICSALTPSAAAQQENPLHQPQREPENPIFGSSLALNNFYSMLASIASSQMDKNTETRGASATLIEAGKISDWISELEDCVAALESNPITTEEAIKICSGSEDR
jgi:hypothetical protein